jgi:phosphoribosylamine--glycine ligase
MRICVVGGDGRAHTLSQVLARHHEVVVTPGNPGIAESIVADPTEVTADLFVISPEAPLVAGLADQLRSQGKRVFGPGADGARLEGSKAWMKEVVDAAGVPTAAHATFTDAAPAIAHLDTLSPPYVVKTDGLAAGKGVLVTSDVDAAVADIEAKLAGESFGEAGTTVVIEEAMAGPELSLLAVCDGTRAVALPPAQDFKRVGEADTGPNTGGMGAYSPVPLVTEAMITEIMSDFIVPTLDELRRRGIDYRGTLYAGLMLTETGPRLVEFNVRFGDPEAQVVLPRVASDLGQLLAEAADGEISTTPTFSDDAYVTVACASEGYPASPLTGDPIDGLERVHEMAGVDVQYAGVATGDDDRLVTAGGRVLCATGHAPTITEARELAYAAAETITWPGRFFRTDIAAQAAKEDPAR